MKAKIRYLNAGLVTFLMHGSIITYLFFSAALTPSYELITKPVMVKLSFDIPQNKQLNTNAPVNKTSTQNIKSKPIVATPSRIQAPEITRTSINEEGNYFLNLGDESISISLAELKSKVQVIFNANPDIEVVIQSDASTPFDFVAKALASIQAIGVESVGIITTGYES